MATNGHTRDPSPQDGPLPVRARVALVAVLAVLLGAVAAGSRARLGSRRVPSPPVPDATVVVDGVLLVAALGGLAVLALLALATRSARRRRRRPDDPVWATEELPVPWTAKALVLLVVALLFGGLALGVLVASRHSSSARPRPASRTTSTPASSPTAATPPGEPSAPAGRTLSPNPWLLGAVGAGLAVLLALAARGTRRSRPAGRPVHAPIPEVARILDDTVADLRRDPDPRRAVIAAYARMERALGPVGLGRGRAETAWEYLERVLREPRPDPGPVRRLTVLFERAKFSGHEVTAGMREDAVDALSTIRDALREAS